MTTLVSPGVLVSVIDESMYAAGSPGTVPLVVLATAANKLQSGSTTMIAPGTLTSNAGQLMLLTSQRDVLTTFGTPTFFSIDGSPQYDNQLNEFGILALYQYLGIANTAWALRADIDLSQLIPSPTAPYGPIADGTYWLDLTNTTWGIFQSNGNINSSYAWQAQTPVILSDATNLVMVYQANASDPYRGSKNGSIIDASTPIILAGYNNYNLVINKVNVPLAIGDSLSTVVSKINNTTALTNMGITASIFVRTGLYGNDINNSNLYGDIFELRLTSTDLNWDSTMLGPFDFTGSGGSFYGDADAGTGSVINSLGIIFDTDTGDFLPLPVICPSPNFGEDGQYAIDTFSIDEDNTNPSNRIWQRITIETSSTTTSWWFQVGSTDNEYPGWGWKEATPRLIIGTTPNPIFYSGQTCTIAIGEQTPITITVPGGGSTHLGEMVIAINNALSSVNNGVGVNAAASIQQVGRFNYLIIVNFDGSDVWFHDNADETGKIKDLSGNYQNPPWATAGISTSQTYYGSITGTVPNPSYVAATLDVASAVPANSGTGYLINDLLTVNGGTAPTGAASPTAATLTVSALQVVTAVQNSAGTGYAVNDILTFSGPDYTSPVILTVTSINAGQITGLTITQAGQFSGIPQNTTPTPPPVTPPLTAVVPTTQISSTGSGATVNLTWGVGALSVTNPGNYATFPSNPVVVTGGSGTGATVTLTSGFLTSNAFSINPGNGTVVINVPAAPNNTLAGVVAAINAAFPLGPIVANVIVDGAYDYLQIVNNFGTQFILQDISGTPLNNSGIPVGYVFGRQVIYQGYTPSMAVPGGPSIVAEDNIWINTSPTDRGMNIKLKQFVNGAWMPQNSHPNTQYIPVYSSDSFADAGFGASKTLGSIYAQYNIVGDTDTINTGTGDNLPVTYPLASLTLRLWDATYPEVPTWQSLSYIPSVLAPNGPPAAGTLWFDDNLQYEFLVSDGQIWQGYRNAFPATDPAGPILDASQPIAQSTGAPLVDSDIWIDTSQWNTFVAWRYDGTDQTWVLIDNTDHVTPAGIIFQDARATADGTETGPDSIQSLLVSNVVDPDCPNALLYPGRMLLMNTRWSTNNVKQWQPNYFPGRVMNGVPDTARWVTISGNDNTGAPYISSHAQRALVVLSLKSAIASSTEARAEQNFFNIMATPGYVECLEDMVTMNIDKDYVFFILGDTPSTLSPEGTSIQNWATNANDVADNGPDGLTTADPYAGLWYPWVLTTNLDGSSVLVPPSVSMLQVIAYNDQVAYPWFAPAGFHRGLLTNADSVGYITTDGEEYQPLILNQGQRDVLYTNNINPIAYFPNRGIVVWGQKTLNPYASALSRVNVARLINYLSYNLNILALPFLFEQNDSQTRASVVRTFNSFMGTLLTARALYDYAVVCDLSNNTPETIDANQLWIDVAIKPEIAIEFIYIPIRILATGAPLPGGATGSDG